MDSKAFHPALSSKAHALRGAEQIVFSSIYRHRTAPAALRAALVLLVLGICGCGKSPEEKKAAVAAQQALTAGRLIVKSNRADATVDAKRLPSPGDASTATVTGVVDLPMSGLLPGKYAITLRADGWPEVRDEAAVEAGRLTEVVLNFKSGSLRLETIPSGATVKRGRTTLGKTPLVVAELPTGDCQLLLEYPNWPAVTVNTTITENVESVETVRLPHGKLVVETTPAGANVLLGKRSLGVTPLILEQFPAGAKTITLQAKGFPALDVAVTVEDGGEAKVSPELGTGFPLLEAPAILRNVWIPDNPDKLSPSFDEVGPLAPQNGIVKNLNRKRVHENWLRKKYRFSGVVKAYDQKNDTIEFIDQKGELARYRVLAKLTPESASNEILKLPLAKGTTLAVYGLLGAIEEARWPAKLITFELSGAELLREEIVPADEAR
jgi:hypothetical protein